MLYFLRMSLSTRDVILRTMRVRGKSTIKELAQAADVSPVSVRHHIASLLADGLIQAEVVKHGVGRPRHSYSLTEAAMELFPTRYLRLTNRLLEEIKGSMPEAMVQELFSAVALAMAREYAVELAGLPLERRLERLLELLEDEGFTADVVRRGDNWLIRELSCPYFRVGQHHPEICTVDQRFIATALSLPVERVTCLLDGDIHCTFSINFADAPKESANHER